MRAIHATIINRHRNPCGIFLRIPNTILLGYGLWNHIPLIIVISLTGELSLWMLIPPVKKSLRLIDSVIETEMKWLFSPSGPTKILSIVFLSTAVVAIVSGLWNRSTLLLLTGVVCMVIFNYSMRYISRRNAVPSDIEPFCK